MNIKSLKPLISVLLIVCISCGEKDMVHQLDPEQKSNIIFLGNTFAVKLQDNNYFETLLYKSFPERELKVRNLGWSADEVNLRPRPVNFGTLDEHLQQHNADIIFACFGLNEAFDGPDSLGVFKQDLTTFLHHLQQKKFNGKTPPKVVLVSPIAHEALGGSLPDPAIHNRNLKLYTEGMEEAATDLGIPFIDLYSPTYQLMTSSTDSLTTDGIHLNEEGYRLVSEIMAKSLGFPVSSWSPDPQSTALKEAIGIKNRHFFYKFNAENGEYIYGRRSDWKGGESLPSELSKIDGMVARIDSAIWEGSTSVSGPDVEYIESIIIHPNERNYDGIKKSSGVTSFKEDKSQFVLQKGFEINLFASEMDFPISNPVSFDFDAQGRMWVGTMPSYPHYYPGSPPNDKIIILEDTDNDGRADKHKVFADSLYLPLGFALGDGGAYVTQAPDLVFLEDTDGDDRADSHKIIFSGFGTEDAHHAISNYTWGPDGALYFHEGTFLHSQVETPYGPRRTVSGATWRYEPRTMKLDPYISYPYANPWGNVFTGDGTHLIADVSTGLNYFAPPLTVAIDYPKKHKEMKDFLTLPINPKTCGMEIISSRQFPESAQGNILFNTFIGFQGITQHKMSEDGSGVIAHAIEPLLQSKDPNFRPVDLKFGPDGALYVLDWYNPIIQHGEQDFRDSLRDHTRGRIWRITYKNKEVLKTIDLTELEIDQLLDQLKVYEDRTRYRARTRLRAFPEEQAITAIKEWILALDREDPNYEHHKLEGLWVYQQFDHPDDGLLEDLLQSEDYQVRAAATRVLFYWRKRINNAEKKLITMSEDESARVRVEAIAALSHFESEAVVEALLSTTELPTDDYIDYALEESLKHLKPVWMEMFKKNNQFLANEPEKTNRLLQPLASQEALDLPSFLEGDPQFSSFSYKTLSKEDYRALSDVPAAESFRRRFEGETTESEKVGDAQNITSDQERIIRLSALPGKMLFDKKLISIPAGEPVTLIFDNPDQMPHNVVITMPGSMEKVGNAADKMASLADGYAKNFVPDMPEVLFTTPLVGPGKSFKLEFKAPNEPGDYPFICSFPGHWRMMEGILRLTAAN